MSNKYGKLTDGKLGPDKITMSQTDVATSSTITNLTSSYELVRLTGSTATEIQGIVAGSVGQELTIYNVSSATITFAHQNTGASETYRVITSSGSSEQLAPNFTANLFYDSQSSRWILKPISLSGSSTVVVNSSFYKRNDAAGFSRASTSTFTVTDNTTNQGIFQTGLPVRYKENSGDSWLYGLIKSYYAGTVTILGVELPSSIYELQVGPSTSVWSYHYTWVGSTAFPWTLGSSTKVIIKAPRNNLFFVGLHFSTLSALVSGNDWIFNFTIRSEGLLVLTSNMTGNYATSVMDSAVLVNKNRCRLGYNDKFALWFKQQPSGALDYSLSCIFVSPPDEGYYNPAESYGFIGSDSGGSNYAIAVIDYDLGLCSTGRVGTLTTVHPQGAGTKGTTYGYFSGGSVYNVIEYINRKIWNSNGADRGDLTQAGMGLCGINGTTYSFNCCRYLNPTYYNIIDYIDNSLISGNASDRGDATETKAYVCGVDGHGSYGYICGGYTGSSYTNVIEYFDTTLTSGNASDVGDLTVARSEAGGCKGNSYGFVCAGYTGANSNIIDYFDNDLTSTNAADRGDTTSAARYCIGFGNGVTGIVVGSTIINHLDLTLTSGNATNKYDASLNTPVPLMYGGAGIS